MDFAPLNVMMIDEFITELNNTFDEICMVYNTSSMMEEEKIAEYKNKCLQYQLCLTLYWEEGPTSYQNMKRIGQMLMMINEIENSHRIRAHPVFGRLWKLGVCIFSIPDECPHFVLETLERALRHIKYRFETFAESQNAMDASFLLREIEEVRLDVDAVLTLCMKLPVNSYTSNDVFQNIMKISVFILDDMIPRNLQRLNLEQHADEPGCLATEDELKEAELRNRDRDLSLCAVCLFEFEANESPVYPKACHPRSMCLDHKFHSCCILKWLNAHPTNRCPCCKR